MLANFNLVCQQFASMLMLAPVNRSPPLPTTGDNLCAQLAFSNRYNAENRLNGV